MPVTVDISPIPWNAILIVSNVTIKIPNEDYFLPFMLNGLHLDFDHSV